MPTIGKGSSGNFVWGRDSLKNIRTSFQEHAAVAGATDIALTRATKDPVGAFFKDVNHWATRRMKKLRMAENHILFFEGATPLPRYHTTLDPGLAFILPSSPLIKAAGVLSSVGFLFTAGDLFNALTKDGAERRQVYAFGRNTAGALGANINAWAVGMAGATIAVKLAGSVRVKSPLGAAGLVTASSILGGMGGGGLGYTVGQEQGHLAYDYITGGRAKQKKDLQIS